MIPYWLSTAAKIIYIQQNRLSPQLYLYVYINRYICKNVYVTIMEKRELSTWEWEEEMGRVQTKGLETKSLHESHWNHFVPVSAAIHGILPWSAVCLPSDTPSLRADVASFLHWQISQYFVKQQSRAWMANKPCFSAHAILVFWHTCPHNFLPLFFLSFLLPVSLSSSSFFFFSSLLECPSVLCPSCEHCRG